MARRTARVQSIVHYIRTWVRRRGDAESKKLYSPRLPADTMYTRGHTEIWQELWSKEESNAQVRHYYTHAAFYMLHLVADIFSTDEALQVLRAAHAVHWAGARIRYQPPHKRTHRISLDKGSVRHSRCKRPIDFVQCTSEYAWDCLHRQATQSQTLKQRDCEWLLRQFCIIYGMAVTDLGLSTETLGANRNATLHVGSTGLECAHA
ncbi:hypothetical protein THASP1DRAFT_29167 [Thamnocephalis sphaerospora]|uniref:Uncharacterized protein n=1 Tax=Thamnocephalis sphaerospora TaxID=78915 RepID=A0A4P9XSE5_9FUNG|nr:hypothetical protein THASP1DRAFT_29167 [Thamnocephalis sphaerospora]|eukprot:RKP09038.1 hypothetical protein THASP1DRAFT_29167 [Thamnocephalis sphaerospora]